MSDGMALAAATTAPERPFCLAGQIQAHDLAEIVRLNIVVHPQSRSSSAASVVAVALAGAYPCRLAEQR
jgi:hypothetical protein